MRLNQMRGRKKEEDVKVGTRVRYEYIENK